MITCANYLDNELIDIEKSNFFEDLYYCNFLVFYLIIFLKINNFFLYYFLIKNKIMNKYNILILISNLKH